MRVRLSADIMKGQVIIRATAKMENGKQVRAFALNDNDAIEELKRVIQDRNAIAEVRAQYPKFVDV